MPLVGADSVCRFNLEKKLFGSATEVVSTKDKAGFA